MVESPDVGDDGSAHLGEADQGELIELGSPQVELKIAQQKPFHPGRARERMRGGIAGAAMVLFFIVVLVPLFTVIFGGRRWDEIKDVVTLILPVVTSVVSAATGFYYGSKSD